MADGTQMAASGASTSARVTASIQTTGTIAIAVGGELVGSPDIQISDVSGLEQATPGSLTFIRSAKFASAWATSKAGAALVSRGLLVPGHDPMRRALIIVADADLAMVKILTLLHKPDHRPAEADRSRASIDPTAKLGRGVLVGANTVIGPRTEVGDGCILHANVTIGADVKIGPMTTLHPGVVLYDRITIGAQCLLHGGVVIGADGFGYVPDPQGRGLIKVPHVGTVEIGNAVEIGANSCIDRGKFGATSIGDGSKIDNLVQIGHNVRIGRACVVCGVTGIAGSVTIEDGVQIGGQVGIQDGRRIGRGSRISALSGVMCDIPDGETWFGLPASPHTEQMRAQVAIRYLSDNIKTLKAMLKEQQAREDSGGE